MQIEAAVRKAAKLSGDLGIRTLDLLAEIEALAERVIVIGQGRVLADDSLRAVLTQVGRSRVAMKTTDAAAVARLDPAAHHETDGDTELFFTADSDLLVRSLVGSGIPFHGLTVRGASLEEAFLALTGETTETIEPASERSVLA